MIGAGSRTPFADFRISISARSRAPIPNRLGVGVNVTADRDGFGNIRSVVELRDGHRTHRIDRDILRTLALTAIHVNFD